ncbi:hypothetical protein GOODEAATRI_018884 [Goodea atripinnis]|uniref:CTNNB1 binding N-teminal domain-containing protein n=1 Tax=Goodea atripinnis TaxID=208336 RepID=A0ABV0P616_9TELE
MPQLSSGGGDDLGANDEMIAFKDEGEQEEKIQENAFTERDLADLKSSLVNESEINQSPNTAGGFPLFSQFFGGKSHLSPCFVVLGGQTGTAERAEDLPGKTPRAS